MFVDSHAHLDGQKFDADRAAVLARAREAGVETIVAIGNGDGPADVDCGIRLAEEYSDSFGERRSQVSAKEQREPGAPSLTIYATIGIHPHEAQLADEVAYARMEEFARHPKVIAWGEIGLDYFYDHSPRDVQQQVFVRQMELARAAKLPIVIHCRPSDGSENAWEDCLRLIREEWASSGLGGVMHCFTGNLEQAKQSLDLGFMISFAGNVTFPKAANIREAAQAVPLDRMLIETDSPYLAPVPNRGKRNEPAYVKEVARQIAELRGMDVEEIGTRTTQNFYRFFSLHEKVTTV
jgi:TatD DNase family protein